MGFGAFPTVCKAIPRFSRPKIASGPPYVEVCPGLVPPSTCAKQHPSTNLDWCAKQHTHDQLTDGDTGGQGETPAQPAQRPLPNHCFSGVLYGSPQKDRPPGHRCACEPYPGLSESLCAVLQNPGDPLWQACTAHWHGLGTAREGGLGLLAACLARYMAQPRRYLRATSPRPPTLVGRTPNLPRNRLGFLLPHRWPADGSGRLGTRLGRLVST